MEDYFNSISEELLNKLSQVKQFVKKHNLTIGILTEEILREFLKIHLPKIVSVEQGFILNNKGEISKQCDILIYNSLLYSPFYRINDIVVVPAEAIITVIEVKTTINKKIFNSMIKYFQNIHQFTQAKTYLFIYNSIEISKFKDYFISYFDSNSSQQLDHDSFAYLPDEITGINKSYHLRKDIITFESDNMGYSSFFYENEEGTEINALQNFYLSIYNTIEIHIRNLYNTNTELLKQTDINQYFNKKNLNNYFAIELFSM